MSEQPCKIETFVNLVNPYYIMVRCQTCGDIISFGKPLKFSEIEVLSADFAAKHRKLHESI